VQPPQFGRRTVDQGEDAPLGLLARRVVGDAELPVRVGLRKHAVQALAQRALDLERQYGLEFPRFVTGLRKMNRHDKDHLFA